MADPYRGYDVMAKRDSPSWNDQTRAAIDARLALPETSDAVTPVQRATLAALIDRVVPPPEGRPPTNTLAILLDKIGGDKRDGFRLAGFPPLAEAWARGLDAIEAEAQARHGAGFAALGGADADALLSDVERGRVVWDAIDAKAFWGWRVIPDIVSAYYSHPSTWSAIGFGGPASPRGYVRLEANRRDPWEGEESGR